MTDPATMIMLIAACAVAIGAALWLGRHFGAVLTIVFAVTVIAAMIVFFAAMAGVVLVVGIIIALGLAGYRLGRRGAAYMRGGVAR